MRDKCEYYFVIFLIRFFKILPNKFVYKILEKISIFLFYILKNRQKLALKNIQNAYNISYHEAKKLAIKNYISISKTLAEIIFILNDKISINSLIINNHESINTLKNITKDNQNSIFFITAHFGNWELLAHYVATIGYPMLGIGREGNNSLIEQNLTLPFRKKFGNSLAYKHEAMIKMVKTLKNQKNIGILIDQKAGNINSIDTTFFNQKCKTTKTIALLKLKFNPLIILAFARRNKENKYEIIIKKLPDFTLSKNKEQDILNITQNINNIFEEIVKTAPEQWFWMHNRWKMD